MVTIPTLPPRPGYVRPEAPVNRPLINADRF